MNMKLLLEPEIIECQWTPHCRFGNMCPGGECVFAENIEKKFEEEGILPCRLMMGVGEDHSCYCTLFRQKTLGEINCIMKDEKNCILFSSPSFKKIIPELDSEIIIHGGPSAVNEAVNEKIKKNPLLLQRIIKEIS